ncbi:MAG: winged helix-turn-helix domain-containing protein [Rhodothermales bacterium]
MNVQLDPVIHAPNRLRICAMLAPLEEAEFKVLREELGVSDSVLSKQISQLVDAGYVKIRKAAVNGRQRTWAQLTDTGRNAFDRHIEALQRIIAGTG